jgi:hypothetical protein
MVIRTTRIMIDMYDVWSADIQSVLVARRLRRSVYSTVVRFLPGSKLNSDVVYPLSAQCHEHVQRSELSVEYFSYLFELRHVIQRSRVQKFAGMIHQGLLRVLYGRLRHLPQEIRFLFLCRYFTCMKSIGSVIRICCVAHV